MRSREKRTVAFMLLLVGSLASASSLATDPNTGRNLAATCALCHGTDGKSVGTFPALAGQDREELSGKLKQFKADKGAPTIMHQIAKGFSDEQIEQMAAYFSAQR